VAYAQSPADSLSKLTQPHNYVLKRVSSYDRTGGNDDYRPMAVGETLTLLDEPGPGEISHVWITIASGERYHLKKMVLRMYWDGEATPSVEAPVGDFFGLGPRRLLLYQSIPLSVGGDKALNCFFPMPFSEARSHHGDKRREEQVGRFTGTLTIAPTILHFPRTRSTSTLNTARQLPTWPWQTIQRI